MASYQIVSKWNLDYPIQVLSISSKINYNQPKNQSKKTSSKKKSHLGVWLFIIIVFFIVVSSYHKNEISPVKNNKEELTNTQISVSPKFTNEPLNKKIQEVTESSKKSATPSKSVIPSIANNGVKEISDSEEDKTSERNKTNKNEASKDLSSLKDL